MVFIMFNNHVKECNCVKAFHKMSREDLFDNNEAAKIAYFITEFLAKLEICFTQLVFNRKCKINNHSFQIVILSLTYIENQDNVNNNNNTAKMTLKMNLNRFTCIASITIVTTAPNETTTTVVIKALQIVSKIAFFDYSEFFTVFRTSKLVDIIDYYRPISNFRNQSLSKISAKSIF